MKFVDLKTQYQCYRQEIDKEIKSVLERNSFILGPALEELEKDLANYSGVKHAIGCSNGTDALLLALMSISIQPGDEVITTPYSFIATAEVISFLGAKPVFVDVIPETFNIDPEKIVAAINSKTKAIIPVSLFGEIADLKKINQIANTHGLIVIEDAAQSYGAIQDGKKSTGLSTLATTSFFPAKPLGGYGDGGALFTDDDELAKKLRSLLNHGQSQRYHHTYIGMNARLDELQAAVLKVKLKYLDQEIDRRQKIAHYYNENLNKEIYSHQATRSENLNRSSERSACAQYSLVVKSHPREQILDYLKSHQIPTAVYYPIPLHLQQAFSNLHHRLGDFPVAEKLSEIMFSIPIHPFLTDAEVEKVVKVLNSLNH